MKYLCDPHVIPTNTCPPSLAELERITAGFVSFSSDVQLDIADGIFAPATSWPYTTGEKDRSMLPLASSMHYEIHLMVQDPDEIGEMLARAGAKRLLPHVEVLTDITAAREMFARWRAAGAQEIGLALLIDTPLEAIDPYIAEIDVVQLMSIEKIGAQGQPFDERTLHRVEELHARYPDLLVSVDGGIGEGNIELLVRAGANRLCVGSAISKSDDPAKAYLALMNRAMQGCAPLSVEVTV